jgi:Tfp pilus assembly protein PilF
VWYYGTALILSGDTTQAIAVMHQAAVRDPRQCTFMFRFGLLLNAKLQHQASTGILRQRLAHCDDSLNARIHLFIGNNFFADSLLDSAAESYRTSLTLDPSSGYTQVRLAETYELLGKDSAATELYEGVISRGERTSASAQERKDAINAILKLNASDFRASKWQSIISHTQRGLTIDDKNSILRLYMAIAYQGDGETAQACKWYREVLKVDPNNATAKKNLTALGC